MRKTESEIESQENLLSTQPNKSYRCKKLLCGCNVILSYVLIYGLGFGTNYIINKHTLCDGSF